jgi:hypothetical protein
MKKGRRSLEQATSSASAAAREGQSGAQPIKSAMAKTTPAAHVRVIEETPAYWRVVFEHPPFNIVDATIFEGLQVHVSPATEPVKLARCPRLLKES